MDEDSDYQLGDFLLLWGTTDREGYIRYIGPTNIDEGIWYGIELTKGQGLNNGLNYFSCSPKTGIFIQLDKIKGKLILNKKYTKPLYQSQTPRGTTPITSQLCSQFPNKRPNLQRANSQRCLNFTHHHKLERSQSLSCISLTESLSKEADESLAKTTPKKENKKKKKKIKKLGPRDIGTIDYKGTEFAEDTGFYDSNKKLIPNKIKIMDAKKNKKNIIVSTNKRGSDWYLKRKSNGYNYNTFSKKKNCNKNAKKKIIKTKSKTKKEGKLRKKAESEGNILKSEKKNKTNKKKNVKFNEKEIGIEAIIGDVNGTKIIINDVNNKRLSLDEEEQIDLCDYDDINDEKHLHKMEQILELNQFHTIEPSPLGTPISPSLEEGTPIDENRLHVTDLRPIEKYESFTEENDDELEDEDIEQNFGYSPFKLAKIQNLSQAPGHYV